MCTQMRRCVNGSYVTDNAAKKQTTETQTYIRIHVEEHWSAPAYGGNYLKTKTKRNENRNDKLKKPH